MNNVIDFRRTPRVDPGLLPLSLRRVRMHDRSVLRSPSNEERVATFRARRSADLDNAYPWPHRQAANDSPPDLPPAA